MKKKKELIYEGLGFPVYLKNVNTRVIMGEVQPMINHAELEKQVFEILLWGKAKLSGAQLAFVRTFMGLTQDRLANRLGLKNHGRVSQWEKMGEEATGMNPATELAVRMLMANYLGKVREFSLEFESVLSGELSDPIPPKVA